MSCLPMRAHGCGLVLRTAEPQWSLLGCLGKPGWRREEDKGLGPLQPPQEPASWTRVLPGPKSQGFRLRGPQCRLFLSPSVSACAIGDLSLCPSLSSFSLISLYCLLFSLCVCLCALIFLRRLSFCPCLLSFMNSLPPACPVFLCASPGSLLSCTVPSCPRPLPTFIYVQPLLSSPCHPSPKPPNLTCRKREKRKKKIKTQKSRTKTDLECVAKCCVLLVACECPCGPQPARLPVCCVLPACPSCR